MKKTLTIVVVVALYSCLEAIFLLTFLTPNLFGVHFELYQAFVGWSQLLLIPGIAVLFSRLMYGAKSWRNRAIKIVAAGALGVPLFLIAFVSTGAAIAWAESVNPILFVFSFVVLGGGFTFGMIWIALRMNRRSIPIEAERWLEERQHKPIDRKRRSQGIRVALWIPSLTVLLVGTCMLPIWGLLSHALHPHAGHLGQFRVPVPLTSVVRYSDRDATSGYVWADFMTGHGSPLLGVFYPSKGLRLSDSGFRINVSNDPSNTDFTYPPKHEEINGQRQIVIGDDNIKCLEFIPSYLDDSSIIFVTCDGRGRFSASFAGEKTDLPAFYRMLEGTMELK